MPDPIENTDQSTNKSVDTEKSAAEKLYPDQAKQVDDAVKVDDPAAVKSAEEIKAAEDAKLADEKKLADDKAKLDEKKVDDPAKVPEYKVPDVFKENKGLVDEVLKFAEDNKLSKEQTQVLLDREAAIVANQQKVADQKLETQKGEWAKQSKADPEIGGEKFAESIKLANHGFKVAPPEVQRFLENSGLANQPSIIKFFIKIAKSGMAGKLVPGPSEQHDSQSKSAAEKLYPHMK